MRSSALEDITSNSTDFPSLQVSDQGLESLVWSKSILLYGFIFPGKVIRKQQAETEINKYERNIRLIKHHKFSALGTCMEGSWSRAVTSIPKRAPLPTHLLCSCMCTAFRWMFDHFHSQMWLDTSWWSRVPASPKGARHAFLNPGKNNEAVALNHSSNLVQC